VGIANPIVLLTTNLAADRYKISTAKYLEMNGDFFCTITSYIINAKCCLQA